MFGVDSDEGTTGAGLVRGPAAVRRMFIVRARLCAPHRRAPATQPPPRPALIGALASAPAHLIPTNSARAMIAWPLVIPCSPGMAAIASTLW